MIVKDEFLEGRRIELAISPELQRDFRHAIRLTGSVDAERVSFTLGSAHHCIEKRRGEKKQCAEDQGDQGKPGWVGDAAHAPSLAPAPKGGVKENSSKCESDEDRNSQVRQQFRA